MRDALCDIDSGGAGKALQQREVHQLNTWTNSNCATPRNNRRVVDSIPCNSWLQYINTRCIVIVPVKKMTLAV